MVVPPDSNAIGRDPNHQFRGHLATRSSLLVVPFGSHSADQKKAGRWQEWGPPVSTCKTLRRETKSQIYIYIYIQITLIYLNIFVYLCNMFWCMSLHMFYRSVNDMIIGHWRLTCLAPLPESSQRTSAATKHLQVETKPQGQGSSSIAVWHLLIEMLHLFYIFFYELFTLELSSCLINFWLTTMVCHVCTTATVALRVRCLFWHHSSGVEETNLLHKVLVDNLIERFQEISKSKLNKEIDIYIYISI